MSHSTNKTLDEEVAGRFAVQGSALIDGILTSASLVICAGRIAEIITESSSAALPMPVYRADVIAPGYIDLQVNGGFGVEVGADPKAILHLSSILPSTGVTAFLPTVVSSTADFYPRAFRAFQEAINEAGATPLGMHTEGPFLSPERSGAHSRAAVEAASRQALSSLLDSDVLRLVTIAPEVPGGLDYIRRFRERGVVVSLGHTNATYEEFIEGVDAGASLVTHLYSAMSPFRHREPGAVGAALLDDRTTVALIADGVHTHPASLQLALRCKGADRVALVTDAIAGAGMASGVYRLQGRAIHVTGETSRLADGTLAGSGLTLDKAVRYMVDLAGARVADALRMASEVPARILGLDDQKGRLKAGFDADLVLLDADLEVQATFVAGKLFYQRDGPKPA